MVTNEIAKLFDLTGKVALVTGGNGGIGFGMASAIAGAGATLFIVGRNAEKNASAVKAIETAGGTAASTIADIRDEASCKAAVDECAKRFGTIDILVNNAGISIRKKPETYTMAEWHAVVDTNLTASFMFSQMAHPLMKQNGRGKIINVGSMMSIFGTPLSVPYAASKGGVVQMTRALATAWATDGIQVNAVLPGYIDTDLTKMARTQVPNLNERVIDRTPAARWGLPDDFAGITVFLSSSASDFITGTAIPVDGGYSIKA
jgi:2-dehydro-3-deoxy-D-gluconate 5-dehydrogenase